MAILKPCAEPSCPRLVKLGVTRCPDHVKPRSSARWAKGSTRKWREQRERILKRDGHQCTAILRSGQRCLVTSGLEIHHLTRGVEVNVPDHLLTTLCEVHHRRAKAA